MFFCKAGLLAAAALATAIPMPLAAEPAAQTILSGERKAQLDALLAEAAEIDKYADPLAYRTAYERALAFAQTLYPVDHPELLVLETEVDFTYFMLGELEALPTRLLRAERIFAAAGPDYRGKYIETINNLGVINEALGRNEAALGYQRKAVELWREDAPPEGSSLLVQGLNNLAWSLRGRGDLEGALSLSAEALAIAEELLGRGSDDADLLDAYFVGVNNRSIFLAGLRRESEAEAIVRTGLAKAIALLGPEHPRVGNILLNGSLLLVRTGKLEEAETMARRALAIRDAAFGAASPSSSEARLNLLTVLNAQRRYEEALPLAQYTVEALTAAQGATAPQTLEARAKLATNYFSSGKIDEGIAQTREVIAGYQSIREPGHEDIEWYQQMLSLQLGRAARWAEAIPVLAELEASRAGTPDEFRKDHIAMLALRAVAEGKAGDPDLARAYLDRAAEPMIAIWRGEVEAEGAQGRPDVFTDWALGWLAVAAGDIGELERSFAYAQYVGVGASERGLLRARQRDAANDPQIAQALRERQDLIEQREQQLAAFQAAASSGDSDATTAANSAIAALDAQIAQTSTATAPLLSPETLAGLQPRIARDGALVFIVGTDIHTRIYVVTDEGLSVEDSPRPTLIVNRLVDQLRANIEAGIATQAPYDTEAASALYQAIFTPEVLAALQGKTQISVIARGSLAKLPFGMLVDAAGRFALEDHAFAYPIGLAEFAAGRGAGGRYGEFLGIGAPLLPGDGAAASFRGADNVARISSLGALGLAEGELRAMAQAMNAQSSTILAGPMATEAGVRAANLTSADVLTFATHGLMGGELAGLDEAALVLSPPAAGQEVRAEDDGLLTVSEIARLDLSARLVVLSACNSASGNGANGEAFGGLASAFLYAGAQSLLASHWRVRDDAAARLTVAMAQGTAAGLAPAEALRQAKLDLMADTSVEQGAHPAIWAPFVYIGS